MVLPWLRVENQRVLCAAAKAVGAPVTPLYGAIATLDSKSFQIFLKWPETIGLHGFESAAPAAAYLC
jgi:hypothetical protein